ncbi:hypothetical protein ACOTXY_25170, partial [Enterobacter cloacae complex sp. BZL2001]|uniref:hypothetical protein n=1 Tax=Enterobacter cloacae complex sp. BZL2001 TaxID=3412323 RepID=UPI003BA6256E
TSEGISGKILRMRSKKVVYTSYTPYTRGATEKSRRFAFQFDLLMNTDVTRIDRIGSLRW